MITPHAGQASKKSILISGVLLVLFLIVRADANIAARWNTFAGFTRDLTAFGIWIIWVIHLRWMLLKNRPVAGKKVRRWAGFLGGLLASVVASSLVAGLGQARADALRTREIQMAVDAGLREDCLQLMLHWPIKESRLERENPAFDKLPASIRMLPLVYVTYESIDIKDALPSVGLCTDGWAGFARGVRVFKSDQDAAKLGFDPSDNNANGGCRRIAPGVYYCWDST